MFTEDRYGLLITSKAITRTAVTRTGSHYNKDLNIMHLRNVEIIACKLSRSDRKSITRVFVVYPTKIDLYILCIVFLIHYDDVIMSTIASQIISLTIVYSTIYSGADQSKHQSSASLAFVWGIHRGPVNSPHKWPVTRKMFPFDDVIMRTYIIDACWGSCRKIVNSLCSLGKCCAHLFTSISISAPRLEEEFACIPMLQRKMNHIGTSQLCIILRFQYTPQIYESVSGNKFIAVIILW